MSNNENAEKGKYAAIGIPVMALVAAGMCGAQIWVDSPRPVRAWGDMGNKTSTPEVTDKPEIECKNPTETAAPPATETPYPPTATDAPPPTETSMPTQTALPTETTVPSETAPPPTETSTSIPTETSIPSATPTGTLMPTNTVPPPFTPTHTPEPVEEKLPASGGEDPVSENTKKALAAVGLLATYIAARKVGLWRREDDREGDAP